MDPEKVGCWFIITYNYRPLYTLLFQKQERLSRNINVIRFPLLNQEETCQVISNDRKQYSIIASSQSQTDLGELLSSTIY